MNKQEANEVVVRQVHMRACRYCSKGVREFFSRHGLDYSLFLREGIPASQLEATGDVMATKVVEVARGWKQ